MNLRLIFTALGICSVMAAGAQQTYEMGNPDDEANYGYLRHYLPLKQYVNRVAYPNFKLGLALAANDYVNTATVRNVANNYFDEVVTGNAMKMSSCVSGDGSMNFTTVRNFVSALRATAWVRPEILHPSWQ